MFRISGPIALCLLVLFAHDLRADEKKHFFVQSTETKDGQKFGSVPTNFGAVDLVVQAREHGWMSASISYRGTEIRTSAPYPSLSLEGLYHFPNEDVLVLSHGSMARGMPSEYYLVRITRNGMTNIGAGNDFSTVDGTFSVEQKGATLVFDLGFEKGRRKRAVYSAGDLQISLTSSANAGRLPKEDCASVLNVLERCVGIESCKKIDFIDSGLGGMGTYRYFHSLQEKPIFRIDTFTARCEAVCTSKVFKVKDERKLLCGY